MVDGTVHVLYEVRIPFSERATVEDRPSTVLLFVMLIVE